MGLLADFLYAWTRKNHVLAGLGGAEGCACAEKEEAFVGVMLLLDKQPDKASTGETQGCACARGNKALPTALMLDCTSGSCQNRN